MKNKKILIARLKKYPIRCIENFFPTVVKNINIIRKFFLFGKRDVGLYYHRALHWIKNNTISEKGIISNSLRNKTPHFEVTGYLIPTLMCAGELDLAEQYAEFLSRSQRPNGAFTGPDGVKEYVFDSGQALRGLARASETWQRFKPFVAKTADYILSLIEENGRIPSMYEGVTDNINMFILPALVQASEASGDPKYSVAAKKSLNYYKNVPGILDSNLLTHYLAYIIDGFIDMGESDFVRLAVKEFFLNQSRNGKITAYPNVSWSCSAGAAQFAVVAYKLGMKEQGDKILDYLCKLQNISGGFYGSYGFGGNYFNDAEIGWTNKFFMDAIHLKFFGDKRL